MSYLLGIDLGSSSVKVSLVPIENSKMGIENNSCLAANTQSSVFSSHFPKTEAPIKAWQPGWAEQRPDDWWEYFKRALEEVKREKLKVESLEIEAIGISYQMHGLVCLDKDLRPLRDAIIWCDSRGVPYGERAPIPGNFTAAKLAWVKEHEPEIFEKIRYIMLPGDYLALRLTGTPATTACGLSEMMLWEFGKGGLSVEMMEYLGFPTSIIPPLVPTFGEQGRVSSDVAKELGIKEGIPVTYRAGDQPNNALSLRVLHPGEVASTAGTSGVVYGVGKNTFAEPRELVERTNKQCNKSTLINTFLHVNHTLGLMHCINGCGILNSWLHHNVASDLTYDQMNDLAASVPVGSEGVSIIPFGNGAERVLGNKDIGASIQGLNFNIHSRAHLLRAAQEGIAFAFMYGMEKMNNEFTTIHAGKANLFLSPIFRDTLASLSGATIRLYDTDGSVGAARGAGIGAGIYANEDGAFASLRQLATIEPREDYAAPLKEAYLHWKSILGNNHKLDY